MSRGFTLMELMIVVMLVALMALIASPSFSEARNDRITFDYARQFQQILVQGRGRAAGTGSAHLAVFGPGADKRGYVRLYQALDGKAGTATDPGPNPVSSCKANASQWTQATTEPPTLSGNTALFIDSLEVNRKGINETMNIYAQFMFNAGAEATVQNDFMAICMTPAGVTYAGAGSSITAAIDAMRTSSPFNGLAEVHVRRHLPGAIGSSTGIGLLRRVVLTGGAAPRLRSE